MGSFLWQFYDRLISVLRPEAWVTSVSGRILSTLIAIAAWFAGFEAELVWYAQLILFLAVWVTTYVLWYGIREFYWRSGSGRRIGICYDGYKAPIDDWAKTRVELGKLFRSNMLTRRVRLRNIPTELIDTQENWKQTESKYKFDCIFRIQVSTPADSKDKPTYEVTFRAKFFKSLREEYVAQTMHFMRQFANRSSDAKSLSQVLRYRAEGLFNSLLLHLGVIDCCERRFRDAATFLSILDSSLEKECAFDAEPRKLVRLTEYLCLCSPSAFPPDAVPPADDLLEIIAGVNKAIGRFGDEYPDVWVAQARNQFFARNVEEALRLTDEGLKRAKDMRTRTSLTLNRGVLHLCLSNWHRAEQALRNCIEMNVFKSGDWQKLVAFADIAREYGEGNAVYLQCLYRQLCGDLIPPELIHEFNGWLDGDESRTSLRVLFEETKIDSSGEINLGKVGSIKLKAKPKQNGKRRGSKS